MLEALVAAVYFGDLHIHSSMSSDALGDPEQLFELARSGRNLDFIAITDHDLTVDPQEWSFTRSLAASANVPGTFVAFSGIEWTRVQHFAIYFLGDDGAICPSCSMPQFYDFYGSALRNGEAVAHYAHPVTCCLDPVTNLDDSLVPNVEIRNAGFAAYDQEYGEGGALDLLEDGHRLGFLGVSDDHSGMYVLLGHALTGCHASALTRAAILTALRNRRCFATDNLRTVVDLDAAGTPMGGEAALPQGTPIPIQLLVSGTRTPIRVELLINGYVVASRSDCVSASCNLSKTVYAPTPGYFFNVYGRVHHDPSTGCTSCTTWSSPVRVLPEPSPLAMGAAGYALALLLAKAEGRRARRGTSQARGDGMR